MVGWQESLAAIVEVLVDVLVTTGARGTQLIDVGILVNAEIAAWLCSPSFIIHLELSSC